jgi:uncharacterized RDD family membrane protein YckC
MSTSLAGFAPEAPLFRGLLARRVAALAVDFMLIGIIGWASALGIFLFGIITLGIGFLLFHIIPVLPFIYYTVMLPQGGTIGQRLFGLELCDESDLSRRPGHAEAFVWSLLLWVSFALACLPFLLALTNPRRRAGHDLLSGLAIVRMR